MVLGQPGSVLLCHCLLGQNMTGMKLNVVRTSVILNSPIVRVTQKLTSLVPGMALT